MSAAPAAPPLKCPVCRARFRSTRQCSRCGADLGPLMIISVKAWRLRQEARAALRRRDATAARQAAAQSMALHPTTLGRRLQALAVHLDRQ